MKIMFTRRQMTIYNNKNNNSINSNNNNNINMNNNNDIHKNNNNDIHDNNNNNNDNTYIQTKSRPRQSPTTTNPSEPPPPRRDSVQLIIRPRYPTEVLRGAAAAGPGRRNNQVYLSSLAAAPGDALAAWRSCLPEGG